MKRSDVILAASLYLLNVFDCIITLFACYRWGVDVWEGNPLMAWLLRAGYGWFIFFKIGGGALMTYLFLRLDVGPRFNRALLFASVLYGFLAVWNIANYYALSTVRM